MAARPLNIYFAHAKDIQYDSVPFKIINILLLMMMTKLRWDLMAAFEKKNDCN